MKVKNLVYNGRAVANQFVITNNNITVFQSYDSTIIEIDHANNIIKIHPDYNYSNTTIRHRNNFFDYIGFSGLSNTKNLEKAIKIGCFENYKILKVS